MDFFGVLTDEWGRVEGGRGPLHKICHSYFAIVKLGTPKEDPKNI